MALLLVVSFLISPMTISYANESNLYEEYANKLSLINVFKGTGNGFELDRAATRLEGIVMLIRLLGKEADSDKMKGDPCNFTDVPDWGKGYVNYAYKNGLTKGLGNGIFGTNDAMNANAYITFLLRALDYSDSSSSPDFTWDKAKDYGRSIGLIESDLYNRISSGKFIRSYVAKLSYNTLKHTLKNDQRTLIQKLVSDGAISETIAKELDVEPQVNVVNGKVLTSIEIGELSDAIVLIKVVGYNGSISTGSGFYVSNDGNLVTNLHVISGAKSIEIIENNGSSYTGDIKVIGYDEEKDIAILDINKSVSMHLELGDSNSVKLGEEIYTIGSPFGLQNTLSTGIISGKRNDFLQISAPISSGSSGGALINKYGKVIGITSAGYVEGENLGFAIPINTYKTVPKNLKLDLIALYKITGISSIVDEYSSLTFNGNTINIDDYYIDKTDKEAIFITFYVGGDNAATLEYLSLDTKSKKYVEEFYVSFVDEASIYYSKDIDFAIAYASSYEDFPDELPENKIYAETTIYDNEDNLWYVFFPFLSIYMEKNSEYYYSQWWNERK